MKASLIITFLWKKRTRFFQERRFVDAPAPRSGAREDVTVPLPFFGGPFVSRVILLPPAPPALSRR